MLRPPAELKPPSPRLRRVLGIIWMACLLLAILVQAAASWRVYVDARVIQPPFAALGLHVHGYGQTGVVAVSFATQASPIADPDLEQYWVLSVNDTELRVEGRAEDTARLVDGPEGGEVALVLQAGDGSHVERRLTRSVENRALVYRHSARTFMIVSQFIDVLVAAFLMFVAWMLRRRKFHEPVAILLSFALLFMSAVGSWMIWWWFSLYSAGYLPDLIWLALLLVASPAFPSGRYVPRWTRWVTVVVPVGMTIFAVYAYFSAAETAAIMIQLLNGVLVLTALLCVVLRFRFTPAGVERQQMKWASLGLGLGLLLYAAGQVLEIFRFDFPVPETAQTGLWMFAFILSRLSCVIIALGLLAPLLDYRLNDADAAIGRSAAYAGVTTAVGVVWAGSAASADALIKSYTPNGDPGLAAAISTLVAVAVLVPARTRAMAWTEGRFQRALLRLKSLPERIVRWQHDDDPAAVAERALRAIADGVDATEAALVADSGAERPRIIAAHNVDPETVKARLREGRPRERAADAFPLRLELATYAGTPTTLLIGRRSDGASYSRAERNAVASVAEPLGDALRGVTLRAARKAAFSEMLADIRARLEKVEAGRSRGRARTKRVKLAPSQ